jgi:hypothetical protein
MIGRHFHQATRHVHRVSHDRLEAAKARFTADDQKMAEWMDNNPEPAGKRAKKRHWRKWRETHDATVNDS